MPPATFAPLNVRRARFWVATLGAATLFGLLSFSYRYTDVFVRGESEPLHEKLVEELTGWYGALLIVPIVIWSARRFRALTPLVALSAHLAVAVAGSALHTTWNWASRTAAYAIFDFGSYDYGIMRLRYLMELPNDITWYAVFTCIVLLLDHYTASRARELQLAQLEGEVSRLRLQSLEAQLQPHFLFNALNTVSSVMYEDVAAADTILTRLGDLLRRTLKRQGVAEVPLAEEVETLQLYCDILRARFADRLQVHIDVSPEAATAAVPQLVLQPLVENAVKHGDPGPGRSAQITVRARCGNDTLCLEVADNGPGLSAANGATNGAGVGLANTRRRLEQLYGTRQCLTLDSQAGGGLRVCIEIPLRSAAQA